MRKIIIYTFFLLIPVFLGARVADSDSPKLVENDLYATVNLPDTGLSKNVFDMAMKGLKKMNKNGKLQNPNIVTIADYSQSSTKKRLYVIDLKNKKLLFNTYVAHGRNTGGEYAKSFSNKEGSYQTSLGFYI
jgi:hypothetical protein